VTKATGNWQRISGVDRKVLTLWTTDKQSPTVDSLIKLAQYFHVSVDWMIGLSDARELK
jgi:transcriptional regulator with XRE-family HTH domain